MSHIATMISRRILSRINYGRIRFSNLNNVRLVSANASKQMNLFEKYSSITHRLRKELKSSQRLDDRAKHLLAQIEKVCEEIDELEQFNYENEGELKDLASHDLKDLSTRFEQFKDQLVELLCVENYLTGEITMEFENGVGGNEAMIFTKEMVNFYSQFCKSQGWHVEVVDFEISNDVNGYLNCTLRVVGKDCFKLLRHEAGVHRVQRIPITDKMNRIHTSTIAIKVIPIFDEIEIDFSPKNIQIETMKSSGPGGMNVNKRETAVRILHLPSNVVVRCDVYRTQEENAKLAMDKLKFQLSEMRYRELKENEAKIRSAQVKSVLRSEKIRTFNFPQDRISDHRINCDMSNLKGFFVGAKNQNLIEWLEQMNKEHNDRLRELVASKFVN